ncbi:MAG TPA: hypothetical protein VN132_15955 [Bdellovibrio sp.]|nr:hypothetical protein [Bdellovibrio sp.]
MFGFKLHLFSPQYVPDTHKEFFNEVYGAWKTVFSSVLEKAGGALDPDDFFRNHQICVITQNKKIVCLWTMTMFDIDLLSSKEHHYIRALHPSSCAELVTRKLKRLVSIEYLTVLPEWRRNQGSVLWPDIMIGLGGMIVDTSPADGLIATPRIDLKVDQTATYFGGEILQEPINKMNYPCAVMVMHRNAQRSFRNETISQYIQSLWRNVEIIGLSPLQDGHSYTKAS